MHEEPHSVIVTGGGYGIGRASACHVARAGSAVLIIDHDRARAAETCEFVRADGGRHAGRWACHRPSCFVPSNATYPPFNSGQQAPDQCRVSQ